MKVGFGPMQDQNYAGPVKRKETQRKKCKLGRRFPSF
jgi:hypothetical protein